MLSSAPAHHSFTLKICRVVLHTELFYPILFSCFCLCAMYPYSACSISSGGGGIATVAVSGQQQIINLC